MTRNQARNRVKRPPRNHGWNRMAARAADQHRNHFGTTRNQGSSQQGTTGSPYRGTRVPGPGRNPHSTLAQVRN